MWSWSPVAVNPDGGGISSGDTLTANCIGVSTQSGTCIPSVIFATTASNESSSEGTLDISGYGLRNCIGVGSGSGRCDVGNGLTIIKSGIEYRNTNTLEFSGNLTFAASYGKALINILSGSGDSGMVYATRIDFVDSTTMYKGEATVGTSDSEALWRIQKIATAVDDDVTITWADGNAEFDNVWDNRLSLVYS